MRRILIPLIIVPIVSFTWGALILTHYNRVVIDVVNHPERYEWNLSHRVQDPDWQLCDETCMARLAKLPEPATVECLAHGWRKSSCCIVTFDESQPSLLTRFGNRFVPFYGMTLDAYPPGFHEVHIKREANGYRVVLFSGITNSPPKRGPSDAHEAGQGL